MPVTMRIIEDRGRQRDAEGWLHNAYTVQLRYEGRTLQLPYRTGTGWDRLPAASDVLECVLSDAAGYENAAAGADHSGRSSFEEWCEEYGYADADPEQRARNWRTFNAVGRQTVGLERLLGAAYEAAVFPTALDDDAERVAARLTGAPLESAGA